MINIIVGFMLLVTSSRGYQEPIFIHTLPNKQACLDAGQWFQNNNKFIMWECKPIYSLAPGEVK